MLRAAGVPASYCVPKKWTELGDGAVIISNWLKNDGLAALQDGKVMLLEVPLTPSMKPDKAIEQAENIRWTYNLCHAYAILNKLPTSRFDAWELREDVKWEALEESSIIFVEGVYSRGSTGFTPEQRRTIEFFLKTALERNIGLVILQDRANSGNSWEGFSQSFEALIRSRIAILV